MILIEKLKSVFVGAEIVSLQTNRAYDFSINWIKAAKQRPYHILFTSGLANKTQNTSEKYTEFEHVELYICLPDYWKVENNDPEYSWPIEWLDKIGAAQQNTESWFGPGDTLPAGKPSKALSPKMLQDHFILAEPMEIESLKEVNIEDKLVKFLAIIPIYPEEIDYKLRNSAKHFMARYQLKKNTELIDNFRLSVVKKMSFKKIGWYTILTLAVIGSGLMLYFSINLIKNT